MISAIGYRPLIEVNALARRVAIKLEDEEFEEKSNSIGPDDGSPEHAVELGILMSETYKRRIINQNSMVDRFLQRLAQLFIAAPNGLVLEIGKSFLLPEDAVYSDDEDYFLNRDNRYECIDTIFWVVDGKKLKADMDEMQKQMEPFLEFESVMYGVHPRHLEYVERFDGWSLCVAEKEFPKLESELSDLLVQSSPVSRVNQNIPKKILALTSGGKVKKADVQRHFPHLPVRQFHHYWKLAAEMDPNLSKPGRKS